ncbi:hypothetical protein Hanom_Chr13g01188421 [Helianthus anomalus]
MVAEEANKVEVQPECPVEPPPPPPTAVDDNKALPVPEQKPTDEAVVESKLCYSI